MKSTPLPEEWKKEFKGYGLYRLADKNTEYAHYELDQKKIESLISFFLSQTETRVQREVGEKVKNEIDNLITSAKNTMGKAGGHYDGYLGGLIQIRCKLNSLTNKGDV
mgnify:CR=1 FL=1